jgi:hypothetical protein
MNANAVARHYGSLTPEERFRLILAASGRGDEVERDRLGKAAQRITLSMPEHAPYAHAFDELALLVFLELLEEAARYRDANDRAEDAFDLFGDEDNQAEGDGEGADAEAEAMPADRDRSSPPAWQRPLELAYAAGYVLRARADAWQRFCARLTVPPFKLWEGLPGFERLQRALDLAEEAAFAPEGFLRWLNGVRPAGEPELTAVPLTVEGLAEALAELFAQRVEWWGG